MTDKERAQRMSELVLEIEDVERAKREVNKDFRRRLDALFNELSEIALDERDGQKTIGDALIDAVTDLAPGQKSAVDSVTISTADGRSATLTKEDAKRLRAERHRRKGGE